MVEPCVFLLIIVSLTPSLLTHHLAVLEPYIIMTGCMALGRMSMKVGHIMLSYNISVLELYPVLCAVQKWGHCWRDSVVNIFTDNSAVEVMLRKGVSSNLPNHRGRPHPSMTEDRDDKLKEKLALVL